MHSPLRGRRVVVTRPQAQASGFCAMLSAAGAIPIRFPTIRIVPMPDMTALDHALGRLGKYDWVIFTSVNGVAYTFDRLAMPLPASLRVAAIGPATERALAQHEVACDFVPSEFIADRIADGLGPVAGMHILLLRAEAARKTLAEHLSAGGAHVDDISVYRTVAHRPPPAAFRALEAGVDAITFTSSSTAQYFAALPETGRFGNSAPLVACIGPITAMTARRLGYTVDIVATDYTTDGLMRALAEHYANLIR